MKKTPQKNTQKNTQEKNKNTKKKTPKKTPTKKHQFLKFINKTPTTIKTSIFGIDLKKHPN